MRLVLYTFIIAFLCILVPQVSAEETFTRIRGNIYDQGNGGQGIQGLNVSVNCNGVVKTATTDSFGLYIADFTLAECVAFQQVSSTVTFNTETQSYSVFVAGGNNATLDFYFGSVAVPEFGAISGILVALGSGASMWAIRKRHRS